MSELVHARVVEHLKRLRLGFVAERLDALLSEAARQDATYLDFLDGLLKGEIEAKQREIVQMARNLQDRNLISLDRSGSAAMA